MKLIDTVILLDFLSGEEDKVKTVEAFLEELSKREEKVFIPEEVVVELVYFLEYGYRWEREDIVGVINTLLEDEIFNVELKQFVKEALNLYNNRKGTFLDCLKAVKGKKMGVKEVITFNRGFKKLGLKIVNPYEVKREA
ncbi:MAG TPA: PIN domain-containing protein [Aquifex aeolicus]|nr:PIN domain-containing protein [Aquifex aeolicus]